MALHRHPPFRYFLKFPPPCSFLLRYRNRLPDPVGRGCTFTPPSASASAGLAGTRTAGGPGESRVRPATSRSRLRCRGRLCWARGQNHHSSHPQPPYIAPRTLDSDPCSQLTTRPEAGRRKPGLSRPAHRSAPTWIRPEEVEGPVSGCAIAAWVPGPQLPVRQAVGRGGAGFPGSGRAGRAGSPPELASGSGPSAAPPAGVSVEVRVGTGIH